MTPEIYSTTKAPTAAITGGGGDVPWTNPTNIYTDNGSSATWAATMGGEFSDELLFTDFGFDIPTDAVIDGVVMTIDGTVFSTYGSINIYTAGDTGTVKDMDSGMPAEYGGNEDLWGLALTPADVNDSDFGGSIFVGDQSGGDATASVDYVEITVYWHYDLTVDPTEVPIRHIYKVYSNDDEYLGNIPRVTSEFNFAQDINAVGSQIAIDVGLSADISHLQGDRIVTEDGDPIITEDGDYIYTEGQLPIIAEGSSSDTSILLRNGNRVVVWEYNYWHPNGKAMFVGQINRIEAGFGDNSEGIRVLVLSDGLDLDQYVARGAPFAYTNDQQQTTGSLSVTVRQDSKGAGWNRYGQTFVVGAGVTNIGQISLKLKGTATVTVSVYDGVTGNFLDSVTKSVNTAGAAAVVNFALATLRAVNTGEDYFIAISVNAGQSIIVYYSSSNPYNNGSMYYSSYAGGSGGGGYTLVANSDLYFVTASGLPTTTATYTSDDPSTEMLSPIMADYNTRGGRIVERDFDATGLSLTATFNTNTILEAIRSCLSMSPADFYYYIDLGTNELDFKETPTVADYVLIKGRHIDSLKLVLSIENLKNHLLFSGGATAGVNLYRQYTDTASQNQYGIRLERKSDNRVTVAATANAIGDSYIAEKSDEENHTVVKINYRSMDTSLLTPGKVIGFAGFGAFLDNIVIQIVRREYTPEEATLTLGILPPRFSPAIEKITRGLVAEQTVANPSAPS